MFRLASLLSTIDMKLLKEHVFVGQNCGWSDLPPCEIGGFVLESI